MKDYNSLRKRFPDISPMVLALPLEGLEEYVERMDIYTQMETNYTKIIEILKRLKTVDLDNDYDDQINENLRNAFQKSMEREIEKRRLFSQWLHQ